MSSLTGAYVSLDNLLELAASVRPRNRNRRGLGLQSGHVLSKVRGRGLDLDEVRQYQPGDDVRNIDWKVTARLQKPHTKVFREEQERPVLFVIDQTQSMFFGSEMRLKSVLCAEILTRLAWSSLSQRDRVGGMVLTNSAINVIKPRRSKHTVARLLQEVVNANQSLNAIQTRSEQESSIWETVPHVLRRIATSNYTLVFISDFASVNEDVWSKLLAFRQHNLMRVFFTFDPLEKELPPANQYSVSNGLETLHFNSGNQSVRTDYLKMFDLSYSKLHHDCLNRNIPFYAVSTTDELEQLAIDA